MESSRLSSTPATSPTVLQTRLYEFKLSVHGHEPLLFAAALANEEQAADYARSLLNRHSSMAQAEVWLGMKLLRLV